jgi:hypothetical protein
VRHLWSREAVEGWEKRLDGKNQGRKAVESKKSGQRFEKCIYFFNRSPSPIKRIPWAAFLNNQIEITSLASPLVIRFAHLTTFRYFFYKGVAFPSLAKRNFRSSARFARFLCFTSPKGKVIRFARSTSVIRLVRAQ